MKSFYYTDQALNRWRIGINTTSANPSITLQGTGVVLVDWGDGNRDSYTLTSSDQTISHTYSSAGAYTITFYNASNLTEFNTASNCAWSFSLASIPSGMLFLYVSAANLISGSLASLPRGMTQKFSITGANTVSGKLADIPPNLASFTVYGFNTITGDVANLPAAMTQFDLAGNNTVNAYNSPHTFANAMNYFSLVTKSGGLTSTMVDNLCIDLDGIPWAGSGGTLKLTGAGIGAPTSASAAARTDLTNNKGVSITTN